jgi:hypothetical protein
MNVEKLSHTATSDRMERDARGVRLVHFVDHQGPIIACDKTITDDSWGKSKIHGEQRDYDYPI